MREKYGIEKGILIGDRGMITEARMEDLEKEGLGFISCLTHRRVILYPIRWDGKIS